MRCGSTTATRASPRSRWRGCGGCIDGAKRAGERYGRALVVIAAEQYASRLVVPQSQQHSAMRWRSHKDHAQKALAKLAGPHLPATLKQVEKAVAKAHSSAEKAASGRTHRPAAPPAGTASSGWRRRAARPTRQTSTNTRRRTSTTKCPTWREARFVCSRTSDPGMSDWQRGARGDLPLPCGALRNKRRAAISSVVRV